MTGVRSPCGLATCNGAHNGRWLEVVGLEVTGPLGMQATGYAGDWVGPVVGS